MIEIILKGLELLGASDASGDNLFIQIVVGLMIAMFTFGMVIKNISKLSKDNSKNKDISEEVNHRFTLYEERKDIAINIFSKTMDTIYLNMWRKFEEDFLTSKRGTVDSGTLMIIRSILDIMTKLAFLSSIENFRNTIEKDKTCNQLITFEGQMPVNVYNMIEKSISMGVKEKVRRTFLSNLIVLEHMPTHNEIDAAIVSHMESVQVQDFLRKSISEIRILIEKSDDDDEYSSLSKDGGSGDMRISNINLNLNWRD